MYTWCNRNKKSFGNETVYDYTTTRFCADNNTSVLCDRVFQSNLCYKSVPFDLIDLNSNLRGQNSQAQHCFNDNNDIQFSTLREQTIVPMGRGPCITVNSSKNNSSCSHFAGGCDRSCGCSSKCTCKQTLINRSRPVYGHPDMNYTQEEKYTF